MKMGMQEEKEMEMLLDEIHAASPHLQPIHADELLPPKDAVFGGGGAAAAVVGGDGESPAFARRIACTYGRGCGLVGDGGGGGGGGGDGRACLSPPWRRSDVSSSSSSSSLSGSGSFSGRVSPSWTTRDEFVMENLGFFEGLNLGVDEKTPACLPSSDSPMTPPSSLFHADVDKNMPAGVLGKDYASFPSMNSNDPDSLLFDAYRRVHRGGIERHCPLKSNLMEPPLENFQYMEAGFGTDGLLSRNSYNLGAFNGGYLANTDRVTSLPDDFFQPNTGTNLNRGYNLHNSSNLNYNFQVFNGLPGSLSDNFSAPQLPLLMRNLRNVDCVGFDDALIIQGKNIDVVAKQWDELLKERNRSEFHDHLTSRAVQVLGCSPPSTPKCENLMGIKGHIYSMAKDQKGCRFLQRKFSEGKQQVDVIFNSVIDHAVELIVHPFGNYLMQKLLEACSEQQRTNILIVLTNDPADLVRISLNMHGTRAVQKLIDTLKTRQQVALVVSALRPGFLDLIKDINGNHVVKHCLESFTEEENEFIFAAAAKHCVDIATHRHGCCVLQRCIDYSTRGNQAKLVSEISANGLQLAQDPFGNYVVQYILKLKIPLAIAMLPSQFEGKYLQLSVQQCSSNVVEKCLKYFGECDRVSIIVELLSVSNFEQLIQDPYANYVIQSALHISKGSLHTALVEAIRPHAPVLKSNPHCKRIFSRGLLKK